MTFKRTFTRPLLNQITDHGTAYAEILAQRAETDPALAAHMLESLHSLRAVVGIDADGIPEPKITGK